MADRRFGRFQCSLPHRVDFYQQFNCYEVLGADARSGPLEIKNAFKQASLRHHPDRAGGSHEAMIRVNLAYAVLSDPISRHAHDLHWNARARDRFGTPRSKGSESRSTASARGSESPRKPRAAESARPHSSSSRDPLVGLKRRIIRCVGEKKYEIRAQESRRAQDTFRRFEAEWTRARYFTVALMAMAVTTTSIAIKFPVALGFSAFLFWLSAKRLSAGTPVGGKSFNAIRMDRESLIHHATSTARRSCQAEESALDTHFSQLSDLGVLLTQPSTLDESEVQVARRLVVAFFVVGYMPSHYDMPQRMIAFTDGEQAILVRFRHRDGASTNVKYVEKLARSMRTVNAMRGYVFASTGLSGNAARLADSQGIKWYTLETMNQWIQGIAESDYEGPAGDLLANLTKLQQFIDSLARALPSGGFGSHRRWR